MFTVTWLTSYQGEEGFRLHHLYLAMTVQFSVGFLLSLLVVLLSIRRTLRCCTAPQQHTNISHAITTRDDPDSTVGKADVFYHEMAAAHLLSTPNPGGNTTSVGEFSVGAPFSATQPEMNTFRNGVQLWSFLLSEVSASGWNDLKPKNVSQISKTGMTGISCQYTND